MNVRPGTFKDLDAVLGFRRKLEAQSALETGVPLDQSDQTVAITFHETMGWFFDKEMLVLIVEDDGKPLGYTVLQERLYIGRCRGLSFPGLYVEPEARGGPAFLRLAQEVRRIVRKWRVPVVQACVNLQNRDMVRFYEKLGFQPISVVLSMKVQHGSNGAAEEAGWLREPGDRGLGAGQGADAGRAELPAEPRLSPATLRRPDDVQPNGQGAHVRNGRRPGSGHL